MSDTNGDFCVGEWGVILIKSYPVFSTPHLPDSEGFSTGYLVHQMTPRGIRVAEVTLLLHYIQLGPMEPNQFIEVILCRSG